MPTSSLIVIRLVPEKPVDPNTFTSYLTNSSGVLQISVRDLSFDTVDNQPAGQLIGTASYAAAAPSTGWSTTGESTNSAPVYPSGVTSGIFQQVDLSEGITGFPPKIVETYQLEAVATAIIEVPPAPVFENLTVIVQWGSQTISTTNYYNIQTSPGPTPDLSTEAFSGATGTATADLWGQLPASLYVSLPTPPSASNPLSLQLPSDGTPPPFQALLAAVQQVLKDDPGPSVTTPIFPPGAAAAATTLPFAAGTAGIAVGMAVSMIGTGIPAGTIVTAVGPLLVTLSQGVSSALAVGANITFTPILGPPVVASIVSPGAVAAATTLPFAAGTAGIAVAMTVSGTGIPAGTIVTAVGPLLVTLSQEVSGPLAAGANITFTPSLGNLSINQCQNIAYEIIWSQQPPLPTPPESDRPVEDLYTISSSNSGNIMDGTTPNPNESDRQQFEGQLKSYYSPANANAGRLTNFVYSLSAAVACEQQSISATEVLLEFPIDPLQASTAPLSEAKVILTGVSNANQTANFGVPAAFFYALAATLPVQTNPQQRYERATGTQLALLLTDLTTAINAGTISDSESFVTLPTNTINAARAARRIAALGAPATSANPLAPLGTLELHLSTDAAAGSDLSFAATNGVNGGMLVSAPNIPPNTKVSTTPLPGATSVTLTAPVLDDVTSGSAIIFTPAYSSDLQSLIGSWLAYPPATQGAPSTQSYQPTDDADIFWPKAAIAHPGALLDLVLSALTQGYVIPPPFNIALGDKIRDVLLKTISSTPTALLWRG